MGSNTALRRIPAWVWLAAIVVASTVFRALLSRGIVAPFIVVDEIIWSELARGIASAGQPLVRGESDPGYGVVYPLVISPAYAALPQSSGGVRGGEGAELVRDVPRSDPGVPARAAGRRPRFRAARRAARGRDPVARVHGHGDDRERVLPAVPRRDARARARAGASRRRSASPSSCSSSHWPSRRACRRSRSFRRRSSRRCSSRSSSGVGCVRRSRASASCTGGSSRCGALALLVQLVGGRSPQDLLGAYSPVGDVSYHAGDILRYLVWHAAELSLYVLVIPLAATIVLVGRARSLDARLQAFLAATVALTVCLVPVVAAFASHFSDRIEERNMFYVAPLLLDRAPRLGRARRATTPRCSPPLPPSPSAALVLLDPVRPLPDDVSDHGHADAAAVLVAPGPHRVGLDHVRRRRARGRARGGVPVRAAPLRARASVRRARALGGRR